MPLKQACPPRRGFSLATDSRVSLRGVLSGLAFMIGRRAGFVGRRLPLRDEQRCEELMCPEWNWRDCLPACGTLAACLVHAGRVVAHLAEQPSGQPARSPLGHTGPGGAKFAELLHLQRPLQRHSRMPYMRRNAVNSATEKRLSRSSMIDSGSAAISSKRRRSFVVMGLAVIGGSPGCGQKKPRPFDRGKPILAPRRFSGELAKEFPTRISAQPSRRPCDPGRFKPS
jgi:hypothetical protein